PFNWYGKYEFGEVAPANPNGGSVQSWQYKLLISSTNGVPRMYAELDVDGFQSLLRINATPVDRGQALDIVFDSYRVDSMLQGFKKGDILFTLTPASKGLAIEWKKMQPNVDKNLNGSMFKKLSNDF
ncbi:hypothetical protein KW782_04830, partial [Candidatus Parcubacteria bacterium]|nr:hypothetical protein [Candidatus Parcubacteria bacterium]